MKNEKTYNTLGGIFMISIILILICVVWLIWFPSAILGKITLTLMLIIFVVFKWAQTIELPSKKKEE